MALTPVVTGNTGQASDLNQIITVLQQNSGNQEAGKYFLAGWSSASGDHISDYISTHSQGSVPISASLDTADVSPVSVNSPSTAHLTSFGFQVFTTATGAATSNGCAGSWVCQY